jgi:hypothetical protein
MKIVMASASNTQLQTAIDAVLNEYERLAAAVESAAERRQDEQAQHDGNWQVERGGLELALTEAASENQFLKEDNLRLSNQLQALQQDYLALQKAAGSALNRLDDSVRQIDLLLEH